MQLKETAAIMCSEDYKNRMLAEYWQLKNRVDGLENMLNKYEIDIQNYSNKRKNFLEFSPTCDYRILRSQLFSMKDYLHWLDLRMIIEDVKK